MTIIKRQENKQQQIFLNNLRIGQIDQDFFKSLTKNKILNPEVYLCGTNKELEAHNELMMKNNKNERICFPSKIKISQENKEKYY